MLQTLVPVLLLATVALSSSNILPVMSTQQLNLNTLGIDGQPNDNILRNRYNTDVLNNVVYTAPIGTSQNYRPLKKYSKYDINNDPAEDRFVDIVREDNYDGEGFRKEQWHNYPRQLDRLHKYLFEHQNTNNHVPEADHNDDTNVYDESGDETKKIDNEYVLNSNENVQDSYGAHVAVDPLLVLKIHLAYLSKQMKNSGLKDLGRFENQYHEVENDEKDLTNHINPGIKVKQESVINGNQISDYTVGRKSKRLFSLWSRLQSLSHKGHQLPHRRHLAFYGLQDEGGSDLTAETRATLMRPPGSPLRWG